VPRHPLPLEDGADILNVLRPLPEIEIAFEGGVRLGHNSWLAGHPPTIRVYGVDPEHSQEVLIDGHEATSLGRNVYSVAGWDQPGPHRVWCNGVGRRYSLVRVERTWLPWAAYSFPSPDGSRSTTRIGICGPLVRSFSPAEPFDQARPEGFNVLPSNPVLIGSRPGEVLVARPRGDVRGAQCVAFPSFAPVWAMPAQPLLCDKVSNCIQLLGEVVEPASGNESPQHRFSSRAIDLWCSLILDASRKGIAVEPATPMAAELWRRYRRCARDLHRRSR